MRAWAHARARGLAASKILKLALEVGQVGQVGQPQRLQRFNSVPPLTYPQREVGQVGQRLAEPRNPGITEPDWPKGLRVMRVSLGDLGFSAHHPDFRQSSQGLTVAG